MAVKQTTEIPNQEFIKTVSQQEAFLRILKGLVAQDPFQPINELELIEETILYIKLLKCQVDAVKSTV